MTCASTRTPGNAELNFNNMCIATLFLSVDAMTHEDDYAECRNFCVVDVADRRSGTSCSCAGFPQCADDGDGRRIAVSAERLRDDAGLYNGIAGRGRAFCSTGAGHVGGVPS